jgi:hypothetical protein
LLRLDIARLARGGSAGAASSADLVGTSRIGRVKPEHVGIIVVPDTEDESHTSIEIFAEACKTALLGEGIRVACDGLLLLAEAVGDLVGLGDARNAGVSLLNDLAVLNVEAADGAESTSGSIVRSSVRWSVDCKTKEHLVPPEERIFYKNWVTTVILLFESTVLPGPKKFWAPHL